MAKQVLDQVSVVGQSLTLSRDASGDVILESYTPATYGILLGSAATSKVGFFGIAPVTQPNVPLTSPEVQDVIDALVDLGLVEQSDP